MRSIRRFGRTTLSTESCPFLPQSNVITTERTPGQIAGPIVSMESKYGYLCYRCDASHKTDDRRTYFGARHPIHPRARCCWATGNEQARAIARPAKRDRACNQRLSDLRIFGSYIWLRRTLRKDVTTYRHYHRLCSCQAMPKTIRSRPPLS